MESTRQQKVARLIQKEIAELLRQGSRDFGTGVMISVTVVRISPDLHQARIYLSIFPSQRASEILEQIRSGSKMIRFELGKIVGKQIRVIPEIQFFIDDSLDYAERIDELLKE